MATLLPEGKQSFTDDAGNPLVGGKLYTYDAGTNTPRPTYQDAAGVVPNTNPVIMDARGEATVFWSGAYKVVLKDASDVTIWTVDNVIVDTLRADLVASTGSSLVGFLQGGVGAVARTAQDKEREIVSIADYGASSAALASVNTPAIKEALTYLVGIGGGTLLIPKAASSYLINDTITIGNNIRVEFEQFLQLNTASSTGTVLFLNGNNIELINPLIDGGGAASDAGENGIGVVGGTNIHINGGLVRNCNRGGTGMMFGGKGVQIEAGGVEGVLVDGTEFSYCFMAMSTIRDGLTIPSDYGIQFTNIKADNCSILFFVRQSNINNTDGLEHTVQLNNFYAVQCGAFEGVMQFSRAANVQVSNGIIVNTGAAITALIRGNHRYCRFDNIRFSGDCARLIDLDPSTFAIDSSYPCTDNTYDINYTGTCQYVGYADPATTNRVLQNSYIKAVLSSDVGTKIVNDELRNGYCVLDLQIPQKTVYTTTSTFYLEARTTFASYLTGISVPRFNSSQITFPAAQAASSDVNALDDYEEGAWTPVDGSGAGLVFTTAYGDYVKVGKLVTCSFTVIFPVTASGAVATIGGLPVASQNVAGRSTVGLSLRYTDQGALMTETNNAGTSVFLLAFASGTLVTNTDMSGKTIAGVLTYMSAT